MDCGRIISQHRRLIMTKELRNCPALCTVIDFFSPPTFCIKQTPCTNLGNNSGAQGVLYVRANNEVVQLLHVTLSGNIEKILQENGFKIALVGFPQPFISWRFRR